MRAKELVHDMTVKFGNQILGVHGQELPKFSDQSRPEEQLYWTKQGTYTANPKYQSQVILKQDIKYWADKDKVRLSDVSEGPAPVDPFKKVFVPQISKKHKFQVPDKVTNISHWKHINLVKDIEIKKGVQPNLKWSDKEMQYKC